MFDIFKFDFSGKRVIVRADLNVPLKGGIVKDELRIVSAVPTIRLLLQRGASQVIIMSHLGRPKGGPSDDLRLGPVAKVLSRELGEEVVKLDDCIDVIIPQKRLILLENLRFHEEEQEDDPEFARKLASYADVYINDAFGTVHRADASISAITRFLPSMPGLLLKKEIENLSLKELKKPFVFILGGSKLDTKLPLIRNMLNKADKILLGGAMIFNFYKAKGLSIGDSMHDPEMIEEARSLLQEQKIVLPVDLVVARQVDESSESMIVDVSSIPEGYKGLDIGPKTLDLFREELINAKTIVWNGPMGVFEVDRFAKGTFELASILSNINAIKIVGGGDSASAIEKSGLSGSFTHISTGGGASIEMLSGNELPGISALKENFKRYSSYDRYWENI